MNMQTDIEDILFKYKTSCYLNCKCVLRNNMPNMKKLMKK